MIEWTVVTRAPHAGPSRRGGKDRRVRAGLAVVYGVQVRHQATGRGLVPVRPRRLRACGQRQPIPQPWLLDEHARCLGSCLCFGARAAGLAARTAPVLDEPVLPEPGR